MIQTLPQKPREETPKRTKKYRPITPVKTKFIRLSYDSSGELDREPTPPPKLNLPIPVMRLKQSISAAKEEA